MWLKRKATAKGAPDSAPKMEKVWVDIWNDLEQKRIQHWIERIPRHIQKILELEGGNEYREGRMEKVTRWNKPKKTNDASSVSSTSSISATSDDDGSPPNRPIFGDFRDKMT